MLPFIGRNKFVPESGYSYQYTTGEKKMKIIGICGSPRKNKTSEFALKTSLDAAVQQNPSIETELLTLAGLTINPCTSCGFCRDNFYCNDALDDFAPLLEQLKDNSIKGIIISSPVYMGSMTAQTKAFLDRTVLFRRNGFHFKNMVGGAIAVGGSRNGGQELTLRAIHNAMLIHDMVVVGDGNPTAHFGGTGWQRVPDGLENDAESLDTFRSLGKRVAEMVTMLHG